MQGLGSLPELYVKSDIVAAERNMAKWESNHFTETEDWIQATNAGADRWRRVEV